MSRRSFLLACTLLALPAALHAQSDAPHITLDGRRLQPGADSLAIYLVQGEDTTRTGTLWDELTVLRIADRPLLQRVYRSVDQLLGTRVDTMVDDLASLTPERYRSRSESGMEEIDFAPGRVSGWRRLVNGDSVGVQVAVPALMYNGASLDLVLRAADLHDGWQAEIPVFLPNTRTVVPMRASLGAEETVDGERCWRVDADFAGMPVSFWIGRGTRALRRQVMHLPAGRRLVFGAFPSPMPGARRSE